MEILEKELEDMIWDALENGKNKEILNRGLSLPDNGTWFRQFNFGEGYGVCDLMNVCKNDIGIHLTICELKKDEINISTFLQACRYIRAFQLAFLGDSTDDFYISIILVGKTICKSSFSYLPNIIDFNDINVCNYTYTYNFDGVYFEDNRDFVVEKNGEILYPKCNEESYKKIFNTINQE